MADSDDLEIVKKGRDAISAWRKFSTRGRLDLAGANLEGIDLSGANLSHAILTGAILTNANLSEIDLNNANLRCARLQHATLANAQLWSADLSESDLTHANLDTVNARGATAHNVNFDDCNMMGALMSGADFSGSSLRKVYSPDEFTHADFTDVDFTGANLSCTDFGGSKLRNAKLCETYLHGTNFSGADLSGADLTGAHTGSMTSQNTNTTYFTNWGRVDLTAVKGLGSLTHQGPGTIGLDTLMLLRGQISDEIEAFLRGCGLTAWEIEFARLYDTAMRPDEIANILTTSLFGKRTDGPLSFGGVFISYSHADSSFIDKLYKRLKDASISVWLDRHDMLAGPIERQITHAIRFNDVVVLVLSKGSLQSDWVWDEIAFALEKERSEKRHVLCPVALDDSWKGEVTDKRRLLRRIKERFVVDFSSWKTKRFDTSFDKLLKGMMVNFCSKPDSNSAVIAEDY